MIGYGFAALLLLAAPSRQAPDTQPALRAFLAERLKFSEAELAAAERGNVVTKMPGRGDDREVAVFGIVRVGAPVELFIERHRDLETFMKTQWVTQLGAVGTPPRLEDLARLTLTRKHLEAIRDCRVGDCDVKLPAEAIQRFQRELDWTTPDVEERAVDLYRRWVLEYVNTYLAGGNAALARYQDKSEPMEVAKGFRRLLSESPYLIEYVPPFHHYLEAFPEAELPNVEDRLFWSVEDFGLRPVITVTHVTLYRPEQAGRLRVVVALKQIYSSHYFQAGVKFLALVDDSERSGTPAFYLLYLDRSLFDTELGGIKGRVVRQRLRENIGDRLASIRKNLEQAFQASSGPRGDE